MSRADLAFAYEQTRKLEARGLGLFRLPENRQAGRPRVYQTEAERKRAYRKRKAEAVGYKAKRNTYFAYCSERRLIKIGRSANITQRVKRFKTARLIGFIYGDWQHGFHRYFADCRIDGEWFSMGAPLLAFLRDTFGWLPEVTDTWLAGAGRTAKPWTR
jgi:hypothetical protein